MKKKIFALLLALCVAFTMMPAMALAANTAENKLYFLKNPTADNGKWASSVYSCDLELAKGESCSGVLATMESDSSGDVKTFAGIGSVSASNQTCVTCVSDTPDGYYKITMTDEAVVGSTYTITHTKGKTAYTLNVKCVERANALYAVWLKNDEEPKNGVITENQISEKFGGSENNSKIDVPVGIEKAVQYFCYKNPKVSEEAEDSYTVLDVDVEGKDKNITGENLTFRINDYDNYCCFGLNDQKAVGTEGTITITRGENSYSMKYIVTMPYAGAYKTTTFDEENLIPGENFTYDNLPVDEVDGKKTIYFAVQTGSDEKVTDIELVKSDASKISAEKKEENERIYLAVTISEDVAREDFGVKWSIDKENSNSFETWWTFWITGNTMSCIRVNRDTILKEGDVISCKYIDSVLSLSPGAQDDFFLGIPTGKTDEYKVVKAAVSDTSKDAITLERVGRSNQAYILKATDKAKIGETYYLEATSSGKTYTIPVYYELPYVGAYKSPEKSEENYIHYRDIYNDAVENGNKFYIVTESRNKVSCGEMPSGLTAKETEKNEEKDIQYIEVSIDENNLEEGNICVNIENEGEWYLWISKDSRDDDDGEGAERTDYSIIPCTKEGSSYIPIELAEVEAYSGVEAPALFFMQDSEDKTFYVLTTKTGDLTLKELDYYRQETGKSVENLTVAKVNEKYTYNEREYNVWKVTAKSGFSGALRAGFAFDNKLATYGGEEGFEDNTKFMWILDESYDEPNYDQYDNDNILLCAEKPTDGEEYASMADFVNKVGLISSKSSGTKYINLSKELTDEENVIYILHTEGTTLHDESAVESAYAIDGSGIGRGSHTGGYFRNILSGELYDYEDKGTVTIEGRKLTVTKATLKEAHGANFMDSVFYLTNDGGDVKVEGYASVYLQKGMNVVIDGENEAAAVLDNGYNKVREAVGYEDFVEKLDFEKESDGRYAAFYKEACANVSDEGTGIIAPFCVDLKPGYVVEKITDKEGKELGFTAERKFLYALLDENNEPVYDDSKISEMGWTQGITGSAENGENRTLVDLWHCVAANVPDYMENLHCSELGDANINEFVDFLTGDNRAEKEYSAEQRAAYTMYTVYFDPEGKTSRDEIVFHIKKAEIGDKIGAKNRGENFSIEATLADMEGIDKTKVEKFLHALDFDGYSLLKVYDMTAKDKKESHGLYNITIPMSELATGTALTDYKVVYFDEKDGTVYPLEVETTYVEGEGIAFTTGHFSNYAIIYKPAKSSGGSSGGSGGYVAPTTDNVTNTTGDKNTEASAATIATVKNTTTTAADGAKTVAATVDTTTANKIVEKAVENKSAEVVVDTATKSIVTETAAGTRTEVALPAATVSDIAEKTEAAVTIKADAAEVKLDKDAVKAVAEAAGTTGDVKLVVKTVAQDANKVQLDLRLVTSGGDVRNFNGGSVSITVKLNASLAAKPVVCVYIDGNNTYHKVGGQKNADGTFTFKTGHFSSYAVIAEEEADKVIAEQTAKVEKLVSDLTLKARSAKTAKGNIKVTLNANEEEVKAIEDLGYTVKYKFYRSTKKAKGYKAKIEGTGKTYTNTAGTKGTKYYYKARVMVYDAQGALIAKTALNQCKYACRIR